MITTLVCTATTSLRWKKQCEKNSKDEVEQLHSKFRLSRTELNTLIYYLSSMVLNLLSFIIVKLQLVSPPPFASCHIHFSFFHYGSLLKHRYCIHTFVFLPHFTFKLLLHLQFHNPLYVSSTSSEKGDPFSLDSEHIYHILEGPEPTTRVDQVY